MDPNNIISFIANVITILVFMYPICFFIIKHIRMHKYKRLIRPECITEEEVEKYTKIYIQTRLSHDGNELRSYKFVNNLVKTSEQYHLVLGDTGTGKSTFLLNCYFYYSLKVFKGEYSIYYVSLRDPDVLNNVLKIENKKSTILFLDAFDESIYAAQNALEMLIKLEKATSEFAKIVITSRMHFFDNETDEPSKVSNMKVIDLEESKYQKYLICPFSNWDIKSYLLKKYKLNIWKQYKAFSIIRKCVDLMSRPLILNFIDLLIDTKRDIKYSYEIYEIVINGIIMRELQFAIKLSSDNANKEELLKKYLSFLNQIAVEMYYNISICGEPVVECSTLDNYDFHSFNKYKKKNRALLERKYNNLFSFSHRSIFEYFIATNIIKIDNFKFDRNLNQTYRFLAEMYDAGNINLREFIKESPKEWRRNIKLFDTESAKITYNKIPKDEIIFEFVNCDTQFICEKLINIIGKIENLQKSLCKIGNIYAVNKIKELNIELHNELQVKQISSLLNETVPQNSNFKTIIKKVPTNIAINIRILGGYEEVYKM